MENQKAKYEEIVDWIQSRLDSQELENGAKIESENELVAIFQVSRQTVRHAISVLENRGVVERRRGSGTFVKIPDSSTAKKEKKTMRIAVMTTYVNEYIFTPIIQEMEKALSKADYNMQVSFTNNSVEKERFILMGILEKLDVDGIVAEPTKSGLPNPNLHLYKSLKRKGIPVLFLNSHYEALDEPHVSLNDKMAGKMAAKHLLQCGHRKIAGIFKADDGQGRVRYAGYIEALMEAEIKIRGERIAWIDTEELRSPSEDFVRVLKRVEDCTACVCYNDEVASKLVGICLKQGIRIPEDLSIMGIDNSELAGFCEVPLTSIQNPVRELGKTAALGIMKLIDGFPLPESLELDPDIVIRNSVKIIDSI